MVESAGLMRKFAAVTIARHNAWMFVVYGILCGVLGAVAGAGLGIGAGFLIVRLTQMSSFEGKSGFFIAFMMLAGGIVGFLVTTIGMSIYFHSRAR